MKIKPFSLIDDDEENSSQTRFTSKNRKSNKDEGDNNDIIIKNKKNINSGKPINNLDTAKKETEMNNFVNNNQQIINDFRDKINKEKLFQINVKNKIISQINNTNNILTKEKQTIGQQDTNYIIKNVEKKEDKLSNILLNEKKEKKKSYNGTIYFYIAITMLLYQYLSYIFLVEIPIIQSK